MTPTVKSEASPARVVLPRDLSPHARECAAWFRRLASALRIGRLYSNENIVTIKARGEVVEALVQLVQESGGWSLEFTPNEILLSGEQVVRQRAAAFVEEGKAPPTDEKQLPFLFYRDGIRSITIPADVPRQEAGALFDVLLSVDAASTEHEDLVSLFWQAHLERIRVVAIPPEQTIYVTSRAEAAAPALVQDASIAGPRRAAAPPRTEPGPRAKSPPSGATGNGHAHPPAPAAAPAAPAPVRAFEPFDDWPLAERSVDVETAYTRLLPEMQSSVALFQSEWNEERRRDWRDSAVIVLRQMTANGAGEATRAAVVHALVSWIGDSLHRLSLDEAQRSIELLREVDPNFTIAESDLVSILAHLDHNAVVEHLDTSGPTESGHFAAVAVCFGKPAIDLAFSVMSRTRQERVRAAACTALCYLCADDPKLLAPYFADAPGDVMLHLVFTVGQIGGPDAAELLSVAGRHPEPKVRKQVVLALGGVPAEVRLQPLIDALESTDPQVVAAALQMLGREKSAKTASAVLSRASAPEFETLPEDLQWAFFSLLCDMGGDAVVPGIARLLQEGGLLARKTFARTAAARALKLIGTPKAIAVLEAGMKAMSPVVKQACRDALKET